jgi:hypothetical protein
VERDGARGLPIYAWTIPEGWDEQHCFDIAVALIGDDGAVTTHGERLPFWPFTHEELDNDLRAAGLRPASTTYAARVEHYMVTATRNLRSDPGLDPG